MIVEQIQVDAGKNRAVFVSACDGVCHFMNYDRFVSCPKGKVNEVSVFSVHGFSHASSVADAGRVALTTFFGPDAVDKFLAVRQGQFALLAERVDMELLPVVDFGTLEISLPVVKSAAHLCTFLFVVPDNLANRFALAPALGSTEPDADICVLPAIPVHATVGAVGDLFFRHDLPDWPVITNGLSNPFHVGEVSSADALCVDAVLGVISCVKLIIEVSKVDQEVGLVGGELALSAESVEVRHTEALLSGRYHTLAFLSSQDPSMNKPKEILAFLPRKGMMELAA